MNLRAVAAFDDNYIWWWQQGSDVVVVDPGDATPVLDLLHATQTHLRAILVTHHHPDHVGGVAKLRERFGCPVWGPARETIPEPFEPVFAGVSFSLLGQTVEVMDVPGHTAGHVAYFLPHATPHPLLFCGDTLFSGGCGRLFEGTPAQMLASLSQLCALPDDTQICCAHEYTLSNLKFALAVEPENAALQTYQAQCQQRRAEQLPTLPALLALEREINPFLRIQHESVRQAVQRYAGLSPASDDARLFGALRQWKNEFK